MFHRVLFFTNSRSIYELRWKNIVESDRQCMTIWRMRTACCGIKATNTLWGYVNNCCFSTTTICWTNLSHCYVIRNIILVWLPHSNSNTLLRILNCIWSQNYCVLLIPRPNHLHFIKCPSLGFFLNGFPRLQVCMSKRLMNSTTFS